MAFMHPNLQGTDGAYVALVLDNAQDGAPPPVITEPRLLRTRQLAVWKVLWYALADGSWYAVKDLMPYARAVAPRASARFVVDLLDRAKWHRYVEWVPEHGDPERRLDRFRCKEA